MRDCTSGAVLGYGSDAKPRKMNPGGGQPHSCAPAESRRYRWTSARILPSGSLNQALLLSPMTAIPFSSVLSGGSS